MVIKIIRKVILLQIYFMFIGCPMVEVMSDTVFYEIKGETYSYMNTKINDKDEAAIKISDVDVSILCPGILRSSQKTKSNDKGFYILKGKGVIEDCEMIFDHPHYKRKVIKLNKTYLKNNTYPLSPIYEVNAELEPKSD